MAKKRKKKSTNWFKKLSKIFAICFASVIGVVGVFIGGFAIFGGFKEKVVNLEGMSFETNAYILTGKDKPIKDNEGNTIGYYIADDSIKLMPTNEDATKLNVILSGGTNIVTLPQNPKVGRNLEIILEQLQYDNPDGSGGKISYNKGGEFELVAVQEEDLLTTKARVFVESKVDSFELEYVNSTGQVYDLNQIYPGSTFTVRVKEDSILPANALDKPSNSIFTTVYGQNYFNKTPIFFSTNESVAQVNSLTGEVTILTEGKFEIFAYMPTTYLNNSNMPIRENCSSDSEYFSILDTGNLTVTSKSSTLTSKSITVSGITATNNSFDLYVFENYKYSTNGIYGVNDKPINLNLALQAPQNSNFTSEQLNYKLTDIEIFEGYKDGEKFYISGGQSYDANKVLNSKNFIISKNLNPLYWEIQPVDYTSLLDLYLIIRISNVSLNNDDLGSDVEAINIAPNGTNNDYAYYAYIKVTTNIIENTTLTLDTDNMVDVNGTKKLLATFNTSIVQDEGYSLLVNNENFNLFDLVKDVLPSNATYKDVRFFVVGNTKNAETADEFDVLNLIDDANKINNEIPFEIDGNGNKVSKLFTNGTNGNTVTVQIYAAIYKTDRNGEVEKDEEGKYKKQLARSADFTLVVSEDIVLQNFKIYENGSSSGINFDEYAQPCKILRKSTIKIGFTSTNQEALKKAVNEGVFLVNISKALGGIDILKGNLILAEADGAENIIEIIGSNIGVSTVSIPYNNITLTIEVLSDAITEINIENPIDQNKKIEIPAIDAHNIIDFVVGFGGDGTDKVYYNLKNDTQIVSNKYKYSTEQPLELKISTVPSGANALEIYKSTNSSGIVDIEFKENADGSIDYSTLLIKPLLLTSGDVTFYIYAPDTNPIIKSRTITIRISTPEDFEIKENRNSKNAVTINSELYEKVIGGQEFTLWNTSTDVNTINGFLTLKGLDDNLFKVTEQKIYDGLEVKIANKYSANRFETVLENTAYSFTLKADFGFSKTYYFYIVPKYIVKTTTFTVTTGQPIEQVDLKNSSNLYERSYNSTKETTAYCGEVIESSITIDNSNKYLYTINGDNSLTELTTDYTANSYAFDNTTDTIACKISYSGEEYLGYININITSNLKIEVAREYYNNNEEVSLNDLFVIKNGNEEITISKVEFNEETFNYLKDFVEFFNDTTKVTNYKDNGAINTITKIKILEDCNIYALENLVAKVTADANGTEIIKTNHKFALNLKISTLVIDETNIVETDINLDTINEKVIYIKTSDFVNASSSELNPIGKAKLIEDFIKTAIVATAKDVNNDATTIDDFSIVLSEDGKITFKLNSIEIKKYYYQKIDSFAAINDEFEGYIGKIYEPANLVDLTIDNTSAEIVNEDEKVFYLDPSSGYIPTENYYIVDGNIIFTKAGTYSVTFKVLGREEQIQGFEILDIQTLFDEESKNDVYSNLSYEIFDSTNFNLLTTNGLSYEVEIPENISFITWDSIGHKINIGNYIGNNIENINIKIIIKSGAIGAEKDIKLVLKQLIITNPTSLQNKQVLIYGFKYNLFDENITNNENYNQTSLYKIIIGNNDVVDRDELSYYLDGVKVVDLSTLKSYLVNSIIDKTLEIKINDDIITTIYFTVINYEIVLKDNPDITNENTTPFFVGQNLSREELLEYITVKNDENNAPSDIIARVKIYKSSNSGTVLGNEITSQTLYQLLNTSDNEITIRFGAQTKTIRIKAQNITWSSVNNFVIYNDTKVYNFVTATIKDSENKDINLMLNYKPVQESNITYKLLEDLKTYSIFNNGTEFAKLNSDNGEISIFANASSITFKITAYVKVAETNAKTLSFEIKAITGFVKQGIVKVYAGNNETNLTSSAYFRDQFTTKCGDVDFMIPPQYLDENYSYHYNNDTDTYNIVKSGRIVAQVTASSVGTNKARNTFKVFNYTEPLEIVLRGYLRIEQTLNLGYEAVSLGENFVELTVQVLGVGVTVEGEEFEADGEIYYTMTLGDNNGTSGNILITAQELTAGSISNELIISDITFKEAFIGKVYDETYIDILKELSIDNTKEISLVYNGKLSIAYASNGYSISATKKLVDYVFLKLEYHVLTYSGIVNIVLVPEINISYNYISKENSTDTNLAQVVAPSVYYLDGDRINLFDGSFLDGSNNYITFAADSSNPPTDKGSSKYNDGIYQLTYDIASGGLNYIEIAKLRETDPNETYRYWLIVTMPSGRYYYKIETKNIDIKVYTDKTNNILNDDEERIEITSNSNMDLKEFVYVDGVQVSIINNLEITFNKSVNNTAEINNKFDLDLNGILTPKGEINTSFEVDFIISGYKYTIYLKDEKTAFLFKQEDVELTDTENYTFSSGKTYYISLTKNAELQTVVNITSENKVQNLEGSIALNIVSYEISGEIVNASSFEIKESENKIEYIYGEALITLIKNSSNYSLKISENIVGKLEFDFVAKSGTITSSKRAEVSLSALEINYVNPSIVGGKQYQNILSSNQSFNLSSLVTSEGAPTYSFAEFYMGYSINGNILNLKTNITIEEYIIINVTLNNITDKIRLRIIPEEKYEFINYSYNYFVLKGETIDLTKFAVLYKFDGLDAKNEPIYIKSISYQVVYDENPESGAPVEQLTIDNPYQFVPVIEKIVDDKFKIYINDISFTINFITLTLENQSCYVGENINLLQMVETSIASSKLTIKNNIDIEFIEMAYISKEGNFLATTAGEYNLTVYINGVRYSITVTVNNISINVTYHNPIQYFDETANKVIVYENIYETQTVQISEYVQIIGAIGKQFAFAISVIDAGVYDDDNFSYVSNGNNLELKYNNVTIFSIGESIICYNTLESEIKIKINISLTDNSVIENEFNIRLLPVQIKITNELASFNVININNSHLYNSTFVLVNNVATCDTCAHENNINLNDKLNFTINNLVSENQVQIIQEDNSFKIKFSNIAEGDSVRIDLLVSLGSEDNNKLQSTLVTINYTNTGVENDAAGSLFNTETDKTTSILNAGNIIAIRSNESTTKVTYTISIEDQNYFDVYNELNERLCRISPNGTVTNILNKDFNFIVEASNSANNQFITQSAEYIYNSSTDYEFNYNGKDLKENGVNYLCLKSGDEFKINDYLNGATLVVDDNVNSYFGFSITLDGDKTIIAFVDVITYGYFDVSYNDVVYRIYVKVEPNFVGETIYEENFTFTADNVSIGMDIAIQKNSKYHTLFVASDASSGITFDLNNHLNVSGSNFKLYSVVAYDSGYSFETIKNNTEVVDYCKIEGSSLTIYPNGTYYITIMNNNIIMRYRVLQVNNGTSNTLHLANNSNIILDKIINVTAENDDSNIAGKTKYNLTNKLNFSLSNNSGSYIDGNKLYISESSEKDIYLDYVGFGLNKTLNITIENSIAGNDNLYNLNGNYYNEYMYGEISTLCSTDENISNILNVVIDGVSYNDIIVENETIGEGAASVTTQYFVVQNKIKISENGEIQFYDNSTSSFISQNKLGVILLEIEKYNANSYFKSCYKLNNYILSYDAGIYTYQLNGETENNTDLLEFALVDDNGLIIQNTVIRNTNEGKILTSNGISLNLKTGEVSVGTINDTTISVNLKVYVKNSNLSYGERFIIVNIYKAV